MAGIWAIIAEYFVIQRVCVLRLAGIEASEAIAASDLFSEPERGTGCSDILAWLILCP